jgi:hypothetical protein
MTVNVDFTLSKRIFQNTAILSFISKTAALVIPATLVMPQFFCLFDKINNSRHPAKAGIQTKNLRIAIAFDCLWV